MINVSLRDVPFKITRDQINWISFSLLIIQTHQNQNVSCESFYDRQFNKFFLGNLGIAYFTPATFGLLVAKFPIGWWALLDFLEASTKIVGTLLRLTDRPTLVSPFRERPPGYCRSFGVTFCGRCQYVCQYGGHKTGTFTVILQPPGACRRNGICRSGHHEIALLPKMGLISPFRYPD